MRGQDRADVSPKSPACLRPGDTHLTDFHVTVVVVALATSGLALGQVIVRFLRGRAAGPTPPAFTTPTHRAMIAAGMATRNRRAVHLEDVVIGLLKTPGAARHVMQHLDRRVGGLRSEMKAAASRAGGPSGALSPDVQRALRAAAAEASAETMKRVCTHQLLVGVLSTAPDALRDILGRHGLTTDAVRQALHLPQAADWLEEERR